MSRLLQMVCPSRGGGAGGNTHDSHFGFWVGTAFTVNYIMGCGFLSIPEGFVKAGLILGPFIVLLFCWVMNLTKDYMCEVIGRAEALSKANEIALRYSNKFQQAHPETPQQQEHAGNMTPQESIGLLDDHAAPDGDVIHPSQPDYVVDEKRKYEVTDLFNIFIGPKARTVYLVILSGYMYGALWAYSSVFAASFGANVPSIGGMTCNIETDGSQSCKNIFHMWLGVFGLIAIPFACAELKEQVYLQVIMFGARILVVLLLTFTVFAGFGCDGVAFAELSPDSWGGAPLFNFPGLAVLMPISVYAFIFHHSVPILAQPLRDKHGISKVFLAAFIFTGAAYLSIGFVIALYFGESVNKQCNLNWSNYVGCMAAPPSWGNTTQLAGESTHPMLNFVTRALVNMQTRFIAAAAGESLPAMPSAPACTSATTWDITCIDVSARPGYASAISFIVLIFPALDVLSAFPLNAATLGNNLMSACLGEAALSTTVEDDANPSDSAALLAHQHSGETQESAASVKPWYLRSRRRQRLTLVLFRLLAAVPPVIGCFIASDLGYILQFTGTIGVAIGFMIPAVLCVFAFAKERAVFVALTEAIRSRISIAQLSTSSTPKLASTSIVTDAQSANGASVETLQEVIARAIKAQPTWREAFTRTTIDNAFIKTLYTSRFSRHRIPEVILLVSVAIAMFVFIQVCIDAANGT